MGTPTSCYGVSQEGKLYFSATLSILLANFQGRPGNNTGSRFWYLGISSPNSGKVHQVCKIFLSSCFLSPSSLITQCLTYHNRRLHTNNFSAFFQENVMCLHPCRIRKKQKLAFSALAIILSCKRQTLPLTPFQKSPVHLGFHHQGPAHVLCIVSQHRDLTHSTSNSLSLQYEKHSFTVAALYL